MTNRYNVLLSWDEEEKVWVAYVPTLDWLSTWRPLPGRGLMYRQVPTKQNSPR